MVKNTLIFIIFVLVINVGKSQNIISSFTLEHKKTKKVICNDSLNYLKITIDYIPKIAIDSTRYIHGKIQKISGNFIIISPTIDITFINYSCDSSYYQHRWSQKPSSSTEIKISDIRMMEYQTNSAQHWKFFGDASIFIGGFISLVVAPLISINYKNGGFNKERYFKSAAIGLGIVTIGIPISILSKEKKFFFKDQTCKKKTKIWRIIN